MFIVSLTFAANKAEAGQHMDDHKAWLQRGFDDGVFLLAGRLCGRYGRWSLAGGHQAAQNSPTAAGFR